MSDIATFPTTINLPDFQGSQGKVQFRTQETNFGDGYTQRSQDGLNARRENWQAVWSVIPTAEKDAIINFLEERAGYKSFYFTPPGSTQRTFTCMEYEFSPMYVNLWKVSATFKQVFDLPDL